MIASTALHTETRCVHFPSQMYKKLNISILGCQRQFKTSASGTGHHYYYYSRSDVSTLECVQAQIHKPICFYCRLTDRTGARFTPLMSTGTN
jgi:hypothetical protein